MLDNGRVLINLGWHFFIFSVVSSIVPFIVMSISLESTPDHCFQVIVFVDLF